MVDLQQSVWYDLLENGEFVAVYTPPDPVGESPTAAPPIEVDLPSSYQTPYQPPPPPPPEMPVYEPPVEQPVIPYNPPVSGNLPDPTIVVDPGIVDSIGSILDTTPINNLSSSPSTSQTPAAKGTSVLPCKCSIWWVVVAISAYVISQQNKKNKR